jgi:hypothetical protein
MRSYNFDNGEKITSLQLILEILVLDLKETGIKFISLIDDLVERIIHLL